MNVALPYSTCATPSARPDAGIFWGSWNQTVKQSFLFLLSWDITWKLRKSCLTSLVLVTSTRVSFLTELNMTNCTHGLVCCIPLITYRLNHQHMWKSAYVMYRHGMVTERKKNWRKLYWACTHQCTNICRGLCVLLHTSVTNVCRH